MPALVTILILAVTIAGTAFAAAELRLLMRFWRNRTLVRAAVQSRRDQYRATRTAPLPLVTIQIPLYNERYSARQVILASAAQDYAKDRFDIQVLDDSTDNTRSVVADTVAEVRSMGVRIEHVCRDGRAGFKAGALAAGLRRSNAEYVAIFDADFNPPPDFLRRVLVEQDAFSDSRVAFVQTRWSFSNSADSLFHAAQALLLDRHFYIQKPARAFARQVGVFNGSAGVWRRVAIDAVGGWSADTLTEDLDLSFRCALAGWTGRYLHDIAVPNELPAHMRAFKLQQRRWARGTAECFKKLIGRIQNPGNALRDRWEEAFLLAGYGIHPVLLATVLLWPWAVLHVNRQLFWIIQGLMALTILVAPLTLFATDKERGNRLTLESTRQMLVAIGIGMGLMVNNTVGQVQGFFFSNGEFERTPKGQSSQASGSSTERQGYAIPLHWTFAGELALLVYCLYCGVFLVRRGEAFWAPPLFLWGLCLTLVLMLQVRRAE